MSKNKIKKIIQCHEWLKVNTIEIKSNLIINSIEVNSILNN